MTIMTQEILMQGTLVGGFLSILSIVGVAIGVHREARWLAMLCSQTWTAGTLLFLICLLNLPTYTGNPLYLDMLAFVLGR